MRTIYSTFALILVILLTACGDVPSATIIREALNKELEGAHLDELFEVISVEITGEYPQDDTHHTVDAVYIMEAQRDLSAYEQQIKGDDEREAMDRFAMVMTLAAVRLEFGDFEKDDTFNQERRIDLERVKGGWRVAQPEDPAPARSVP